MTDRLVRQFAVLNQADRLKSVLRATTLVEGLRVENAAEHSWRFLRWCWRIRPGRACRLTG